MCQIENCQLELGLGVSRKIVRAMAGCHGCNRQELRLLLGRTVGPGGGLEKYCGV